MEQSILYGTETMNADEIFADDLAVATFHDIMFEVTGDNLDRVGLRIAFAALPEEVQETAFEWGLDDAMFIDEIFTALRTVREG